VVILFVPYPSLERLILISSSPSAQDVSFLPMTKMRQCYFLLTLLLQEERPGVFAFWSERMGDSPSRAASQNREDSSRKIVRALFFLKLALWGIKPFAAWRRFLE
jgi:hypothetical protein